jgi:hypothetical protein
MKAVTALVVAAVVAIGTTVALAQEGLHTGRKSGGNAWQSRHASERRQRWARS